jgi:uncharacterized protein YdgA (DUF945 family)
MNPMKKIFMLMAILSGIILISPKFIGGIVETEYQSALNKLNENPAITIKSTVFNRQWYQGQVVTEMTVLLQNEKINELNIVINDDISFGPIIFTDEGIKFGLSFSKSNINFTDSFVGEEVEDFIKNNIHLSALLTFDKNIITHIIIDEVKKEVDGNNLVSKKAVGKFVLENENRLYGDFNWGGLSAKTKENNFTIEAVKLSLDQRLHSGSYYQGNAISTGVVDFSISSIQTKGTTGEEEFSMANLAMNAKSSVTDDLMKVKMNYRIGQLASAGHQVKKANLELVFNDLNVTVMQEVNALLTKLSNSNEEVFSAENIEQLSALMAKLLANDPTINIADLSVETPEGKIESAMKVSADKKIFDTANFMSIIPAINATAKGMAPLKFFTKLGLAPMIEYYVEQGFIIKKDENISFNANFIEGQLSLNGNVISL